MISYKLRKTDYYNLDKMLIRIGATKDREAFPSYVYMSKKDLNKMRVELTKAYKKAMPYATKKLIALQVGFDMLNLSPNEVKGFGIKDGYCLVDNVSIKRIIEEMQDGKQIK